MLQERLIELVEPVVESLGYELILLEFAPAGRSSLLRIYIDAEDGINVDDCARVSREVAAVLDVEDPIQTMYQLEVSSPGFDRPLTKRRHFDRFEGWKAKVQLVAPLAGSASGQKKFVGVIRGTSDDAVQLETDTGGVELAFSSIERARLVPDYSKAQPEGKA